MISIIVAVAKNNAIGKDNRLLWHLSDDLKYFKKVTSGHPVIMGYNTFLSVGGRPFPHRRNIVVNNALPDGIRDGVECFARLEDALRAAQTPYSTSACGNNSDSACGNDDACKEVFVIGGGMMYRTSLPLADRLYITEVDKVVEDADTFFPEIDKNIWKEESRSEVMVDEKSGLKFSFVIYTRM
jgi:dihydrofolate reductase